VRDFALGQRGPDDLRLRASQLAEEAGLLPPGPRRLWINGQWRENKMLRTEIHTEPSERQHAPGIFDLLMQAVDALRAGKDAHAEGLLRKALDIDPNDPVVMNNLALAVSRLGRTDESEAITLLLHERHPDYLFGRTAMAGLAAARGEWNRARELLDPLLMRPRLHITEFTAVCTAEVNLYLAQGNREQVEHWLGMWRRAAPDHPLLPGFESRLRAMR
jgi:tetratricopeptide (TPR) repeat protein